MASNLMVTAQNCLSSIGQPLILAFYDTNDTRKKTKHTKNNNKQTENVDGHGWQK